MSSSRNFQPAHRRIPPSTRSSARASQRSDPERRGRRIRRRLLPRSRRAPHLAARAWKFVDQAGAPAVTRPLYVDSHCHVDRYADPRRVLDEAANAGVVTVAVTEMPSAFQRQHARLLPDRQPPHRDRHATVGCTPRHTDGAQSVSPLDRPDRLMWARSASISRGRVPPQRPCRSRHSRRCFRTRLSQARSLRCVRAAPRTLSSSGSRRLTRPGYFTGIRDRSGSSTAPSRLASTSRSTRRCSAARTGDGSSPRSPGNAR
jgi:hypothetical protein